MPGKLIEGHADIEAACDKCHVRFRKNEQPGLCLDCHKPIAADVRQHTGYHGQLKSTECRSCHTEHKGREARIVVLDERKFDHRQTDFPLLGKHQGKSCNSCHKPGRKFRQAATECVACHKTDDKHRGNLGARCDNCHSVDNWKNARFDHGKTRFPLRQAHARAGCSDCHVDQKYENTPRECNSCHKRDDAHKGHYGPKCESCHQEGDWKTPSFRHDRDTRFSLLGRHRPVKCESCHRSPIYREKLATRCVACHRNDDPHKNTLGDKCDKCHTENNWKGSRFDHERDTRFPLLHKHGEAKCTACHKDSGMRDKLSVKCVSCHEADDRKKGHQGLFGEACETCHSEKSFKPSHFRHDKDIAFALTGKHRKTKCESCHKTALYVTRTDSACYACHKNDDIHFGTYDLRCETCHSPEDWRKIIKKNAP